MKVCEEMQKLRDWLDAEGIEWIDKSEEGEYLWICRTRFKIGNYNVSVVSGFGTYGSEIGGLEMRCKAIDPEPIGWLTADDVIEKLKELMK